MNRQQIKALLPLLNSKETGYRTGWVLAHCPISWKHGGKDEHPSFAVRVSTPKKKSIGKCLSCGWGGDMLDLVYAIKGHLGAEQDDRYNLSAAMQLIAQDEADSFNPSMIPDYEDKEEIEETVFPDAWLKTFAPVSLFPEALSYCYKRGVMEKMLDALDVRYDPIQRRVCFPVRDLKGRLMGMQGRAIDHTTELRYFQYGYHNKRNAHVWMGEHSSDLDEPLILTEGPFDLASIGRVYSNVVASFTTGLSQRKLGRIADASSIVTFYDYGKGGDAARGLIEKRYRDKIPVTHVIPEEHEADAGAMSYGAIVSALSGVVPLNTDQVTV